MADGSTILSKENCTLQGIRDFLSTMVSETGDNDRQARCTFLLTSTNQIKKILFFKSTKDSTKLNYCSRKGTLNEEVYAKGREAIAARLGDRVQQFVAEIEID